MSTPHHEYRAATHDELVAALRDCERELSRASDENRSNPYADFVIATARAALAKLDA